MSEDDDDGPSAPASNQLDWDKLFQMAEDAADEDGEENMGRLQLAVKHLESGREAQKLSSIRSLGELLDSDGETARDQMLPLLQRVLKEESSNLDIHCEAAVVFKAILMNDKLVNRFPGLTDQMLENVLQNVQRQKENLSAAAWLETLVDIADHIPVAAVKQYIVPVVQLQAEPSQRVQRRIISTKLLNKLAGILPPNDVRKELGPVAQMLCQDQNTNVRTAMAQRLAVIARSLNNPSDSVSLLLPCLVELCKDDDEVVREAVMNTLAQCLPHFTKESKKSTVFPLVRKMSDECVAKQNDLLMVVAKNLGEWCFGLREVMDALDNSWALNTFIKIAALSQGEKAGSGMQTTCRRMCAFNMPCFVSMYPNAIEKLLPIIESFSRDVDTDVKVAIAASYHEILRLHPSHHALIPPFIELIRGGATEVIGKLSHNLDSILPILYKGAQDRSQKVTTVQLDRIILGCNQLLRSSGNWRAHEAYLKNLSILTSCVSYHHLFDTFVPLLQKECLTARALPCRVAAASSLLVFMRQHPEEAKRHSVVQFLIESISTHPSCYRRQLYLDACECALRVFSRKTFKQLFLETAVEMAADEVSNIRIRAARLLARVKTCLVLPDDNQLLTQVESAMKGLLTAEKSTPTRQLIQATACEMSRSETGRAADREDERKAEEERTLWSKNRIIEKDSSPSASRSSPSLTEREKTPSSLPQPAGWRAQRRAVAVVRPQPVIVMRSPSPAPPLKTSSPPKSFNDGSARKSRLPLASKYTSSPAPSGPPLPRKKDVMSTSTPSSPFRSHSEDRLGLRRSSTSSASSYAGAGYSSSSSSFVPLMGSRSVSAIRRPSYGLTKVSSSSVLERKPPQFSLRIRTAM